MFLLCITVSFKIYASRSHDPMSSIGFSSRRTRRRAYGTPVTQWTDSTPDGSVAPPPPDSPRRQTSRRWGIHGRHAPLVALKQLRSEAAASLRKQQILNQAHLSEQVTRAIARPMVAPRGCALIARCTNHLRDLLFQHSDEGGTHRLVDLLLHEVAKGGLTIKCRRHILSFGSYGYPP